MTPRVVVVGSGIAGLTAALHADAAGSSVTVVTKTTASESNTRYAQGGIAAVMTADDSVAAHVADTLVAGAHLGDLDAVRVLAAGAAERISELVAAGVPFDRDATGVLHRGLEAAHSHARVLHSGGDATGAAIQEALVRAVHDSGIEIVEEAALVDLVIARGRVAGVDILRGGVPERVAADAIVLATGGAGQLYSHTTNPAVATGDGIAAAIRAGAAVADLEFVQFHPTVLDVGEPFLISEAVRGEGAVLRDRDGRRFAFDAHPAGELAPRDIVARAIVDRMAAQDGAPVLLDATSLGAERLAERFPTIDAAVRARGLDWSREPIPVTPAAHYLMGGVVTDLDGRTSIPGLYAVGEVARTGVHGANRLASNSLLEGAVFGSRAGAAIAADAAAPWPARFVSAPRPSLPVPERANALPVPERAKRDEGSGTAKRDEGSGTAKRDEGSGTAKRDEGSGTAQRDEGFSRAALQQLMWESAGVIRDGAGLTAAARTIAGWRDDTDSPTTVTDVEDANLLLLAAHVVDAALRRRDSVGAHFRTDSPVRSMPLAASAISGAA